jgi:hypothetical protein
MKQHQKWFATALAVASGLVIAGSAQAQDYASGTPYLSNLSPANMSLYDSWATATITSLPTGCEVSAVGQGSMYYALPTAIALNPADTRAVFTFTINDDPTKYIWVGSRFVLNDNAGGQWYPNPGYSGYANGGNPPEVSWNGNVVTWTQPLNAAQLTAIQAGNDYLYGFNLVFDPAAMAGPPIYDVTFNSLVLEPAPEPTTLALLGLGVAGFVIARRRVSVS